MDSLKSLMEQKNYDLVIKITRNCNDAISLFYRISAFLGLGKPEDALFVIKNKRQVLETNLPLLIRINIDVLCILGKYEEAFKELEYYKNLPYFNQEVEEMLANMPEYINNEIKKTNISARWNDEKITSFLLSRKKENVLFAINTLKDRNINSFLLPLQKVLTDNPSQSVRTLALFLLIFNNVDKQFSFKSQKGIIKVIPNALKKPFSSDGFNSFVNKVNSNIKEPSLAENMINILSSMVIFFYPNDLNYDDLLFYSLYFYCNEMIKNSECLSKNELVDKYNLNIENFNKKLEDIKMCLEDL